MELFNFDESFVAWGGKGGCLPPHGTKGKGYEPAVQAQINKDTKNNNPLKDILQTGPTFPGRPTGSVGR